MSNLYYIADQPDGLTEAQCDAINTRYMPAGMRYLEKFVHPADGRKSYEFNDEAQAQAGSKTIGGQRVVTDAELAIIRPQLKTEDQMFTDGWCPVDGRGARTWTVE